MGVGVELVAVVSFCDGMKERDVGRGMNDLVLSFFRIYFFVMVIV